LQNNETKTAIEQKILAGCSLLPNPFKTQCTNFIKSKFSLIVQLVLQYDDPALVCALAGFCPKVEQVGNFDKCSVCHFLVGVAESWVESNATEEKLFSVLEDACKIIPGAYSAVCKAVIVQYGPKLVELLLNKENPDTICKQIRLCTTALMKEVAASPAFSPADVKVKGATECYVCKLVVGYVENFIKSNSSEAEIIKEADKVCSVLPSSIGAVCKAFVANYLPQVIEMLLNKVPPQSVCDSLKLCTAAKVLELAQQAGSTKYCQICQFVVSTVENFLETNSTEAEILALGERVCTILPAKYAPLCKEFVDQGLPLAIKYIEAKETPQVACTQIKLCTSPKIDFFSVKINPN